MWQIHYMAVCFLFRKRRPTLGALIFAHIHMPCDDRCAGAAWLCPLHGLRLCARRRSLSRPRGATARDFFF